MHQHESATGVHMCPPTWSPLPLPTLCHPSAAAAAAAAKSLQSCTTLCDLGDGSPPGSAVPGILQARTLEWVAISFSNAWKVKNESEIAQSCPTLRDPIDRRIFQARVLGWVAIAFSAVPLDCHKECCNEHGDIYVFSIMVSSGYMPSSGILGSYGSFNPSF